MRIRAGVCFCLAVLGSVPVFGQAKFEVADVHNSPKTTLAAARGPFFSSGRYELRFANMLDMIRMAYDVEPEKVHGGPSWLEMDRFDVFAKIPASSTVESRRLMLQDLLAERFKLVTHKDSRPMPAWALSAGTHKLKKADGEGEPGCKFEVQNAPQGNPGGGPITLPVIQYTCRNITMEAFAAGMLNMAGAAQNFNNRLVVDRTKLEGSWDFNFRYTPRVPAGIQTVGEQISFFDAVEKQLGLKFEAATVPMPVIVVDNVNRKPTPNSEEAMKSFPPLPTEFEVASLKPSDPNANPGRGGAAQRPDIRNGRLYLPRISVKNLVIIGWDINGDEFLVGAPKWMEEDRYDILAKAPAEVAMGDLTPNRNTVPVNIDALRPMIKALVMERFKMKVHMEDRQLNAYILQAAKPKLKKADPNARTRWQEGPAPENEGNKNANAALGRMVTAQNMTMAQFADLLPGIAPGYLRTTVADATGLEGGWDFTFSFSPAGILNLNRPQGGEGGAPAAGGALPEASEPTGAISLFDAVVKQLGLKLETTKRPMPVLVIDQIERKPIDN